MARRWHLHLADRAVAASIRRRPGHATLQRAVRRQAPQTLSQNLELTDIPDADPTQSWLELTGKRCCPSSTYSVRPAVERRIRPDPSRNCVRSNPAGLLPPPTRPRSHLYDPRFLLGSPGAIPRTWGAGVRRALVVGVAGTSPSDAGIVPSGARPTPSEQALCSPHPWGRPTPRRTADVQVRCGVW